MHKLLKHVSADFPLFDFCFPHFSGFWGKNSAFSTWWDGNPAEDSLEVSNTEYVKPFGHPKVLSRYLQNLCQKKSAINRDLLRDHRFAESRLIANFF